MLAVCTSFGEEYSIIQSKMRQRSDLKEREQRACVGIYQDVPIELILMGVGRSNVEKFGGSQWGEYAGVFLLGYCGGLTPALQVGDLVLPSLLVNEYGDSVDLEEMHLLLNVKNKIHRGAMVSVEKLVRVKDEKTKLQQETSAIAVDMESFFLAKRSKELGIPAMIVKSVADALGDDLPDFGEIPDADTVKRGAKISPQIAQTWRQNMLKARDSLSETCEQLIPAFYQILNF